MFTLMILCDSILLWMTRWVYTKHMDDSMYEYSKVPYFTISNAKLYAWLLMKLYAWLLMKLYAWLLMKFKG